MAKVYNNALKDYYLKKQKQLQNEKADKLLTGNKSDTKVNETKANNETPAWKSYYLSQKDKMPNKQAEEKTETITKKQSALPENSVFAKNLDSKLADYATKQSGTKKNNLLTFGDTKNVSTGATKSQNEKADKLLGITASDQRKEQLNQRQRENTIDRYGKGNIDLDNRQVVKNDDGTISTEKSFSVNIDGKEVLLPSVVDGKVVSEQEAIDHYKKTGEYLGKFDTPEEANEYADKLHNRQEGKYGAAYGNDSATWKQKKSGWDTITKVAQEKRDENFVKNLEERYGYLTGEAAPKFTDISGTMDYIERGRQMGYWDQTDNYYYWSDNNLISNITELDKKIADARESINVVNADRELNEEEFEKRLLESTEAVGVADRIAYNLRSLGEWGKIESDHETRKYSGKPEDYDLRYDEYDAELYDEIYGQPGLYHQKLWSENEDEQQAVADEIDRIWEALDSADPKAALERLAQEYESGVAEQQQFVRDAANMDQEIQKMEKYRAKLAAELANREALKDISGDTEYHADRITARTQFKQTGPGSVIVDGGRENQIYYEINNPWDVMYKQAQEYALDRDENMALMDFAPDGGKVMDFTNPDFLAKMAFNNVYNTEYATDPKKEWFVTDAEKAKFNSLYNAEKYDEALAFMDGLEHSLNERCAKYEKAMQEYLASGEYGALVGLSTVPDNFVSGIYGTFGAIAGLMGNEEAADPNSPIYKFTRRVKTIRGTRADIWGKKLNELGIPEGQKAGEFLNGVTYSIADNLFAKFVSGGMGSKVAGEAASKVSQVAMQVIMSSEATASVMLDGMEKGLDPEEAAVMAIGSGIIEAITEKYSIDQVWGTDIRELMGNWGEFAKYVAKSGIIEGSEEVASDFLNSIQDAIVSRIYGHEDELTQQYKELVDNGMDPKEAEYQILMGFLGKSTESFLAGALSGVAESGARGFVTKVSVENELHKDAAAMNQGVNKLENILDAAEGVDGGEEFKRQLAIYRDKLNYEGTLSKKDRIGLARLLQSTGSQVVQETAQAETADLIKEMATEKAQKSGIEVTTAKMNIASEGAMKMLLDTENITKEERQALKEVGPVMDVLEEIQDENRQEARREFNEKVNQRVAEKAGGVFAVYQTMDELRNGEKSANEAYDVMIKDAPVATEEEIAEAVENGGERSDSKSEVVYDGKFAEAVNVEGGKVVLDNGEQVDPREVKATNPEMAAVIQAMMEDEVRLYDNEGELTQQQENKPAQQTQVTEDVDEAFENAQNRRVDNLLKGNTAGQQLTSARATQNFQQAQQKAQQKRSEIQYRSGSDNFYNAMLQVAQKEGRTGGNILNEGMKIRVYTLAGLDTPDTRLNPESTRLIREASEADMRAAEAQRTENRRTLTPGNGTATMNGAKYGTKAFDAQVKTLPENQRKVAYALAEVGKAMGTNITIINDQNNNAYFGDESMAGITVNLAGTDDAAGTKYHHGMVTLGHEATHLIEHNSKEGYAALRSYIFQSMIDDDVNIYDRAMEIVNSYNAQGIQIDLNGALREIVANSCDQILSNEKALSKLENENPGLYGKVKAVAKSIYQKIKAALAGMRNSASRDAVYFLNQRADELARLFGEAWDEAKTGEYNAEKKTKDNKQAEYSFRDKNGNNIVMTEDQISENRNKVSVSDTIGEVKGDQFKKTDTPIAKRMISYFNSIGGSAYNKTIGSIALEKTGAEHFERYVNPKAAMAIPLVKTVIEKGEIVDIDDDHKEKGFPTVAIAGRVSIDGDPYYMAVAVRQLFGKDNRYYMHNAIAVNEKNGNQLNLNGRVTEDKSSARSSSTAGSHSLYSILLDIRKRNAQYGKTVQRSIRESDAAYMKAVKNGDMETAQRMVEQEAETAGYTEKAYHGTNLFGFTEFNLEDGRGTIFVAYNKDLAATYTEAEEIRRIKDRSGVYKNHFTMKQGEFLKYAREIIKEIGGGKVLDIRRYEGSNDEKYVIEYEDILEKAFNNKDSVTSIWERHELNDMIERIIKADGIYELYTKPGRQLIVDADGDRWNNIWFDTERAENYIHDDVYFPRMEERERYEELGLDEPRVTTRELAEWAKAHGYDSVRINYVYDNGGRNYNLDDEAGYGSIGIFFNPESVKSADPVVHDDNGNVIPLSERFNKGKTDIRYSVRTTEDGTIVDNDGNAVAEILPGGVVTAYSIRTVDNTVNQALIDELVKQGFSRKQVQKWVNDVFGIAAMIAADRDRLDFKAYGQNFLKNNQEYIKTLDGSTLCAKRLLYQGVFNQIQHMLPNTPLLPEDLLKLTNKMKQKGMVTPCSLCYVESRRRLLGKFASEFLKEYDGAYKPRIEELTTTDGLQALRDSENEAKQQAAADFEEAMARKGSANPKLVQMRTEYNGEIRNLTDKQITKIKEIGGLRVQSFSDFEIVHMLDLMQAVMDMAAMDLTSQAYTKVPEMAWVFGDTGIKINLSLIGEGTGLDENGKLKFSSVEGMDYETALEIRNRYSRNVGTILVGMNDDHIIAAMGDDTIDFIIPFHKSGWSKKEMALMIGMGSYKDFTRWQNEKKIDYVGKDGKIKTIPAKKSKISNFQPVGPNGYWNFSKDGTWNAEKYLKMCAKDGRVPKFSQFLVNNGDGSFSLPQDDSERSRNIRKGYWKLLIDFKMYDNEGKGAPQQTVKPNFNMDEARKILENYKGGADELPGNMSFAQEYVEEYKKDHPRKQYAVRDESNLDIHQWMTTVNENSLQTEAEKALLRDYKDLRMKWRVAQEKITKYGKDIARLEAMESLPADERERLKKLRIYEANARTTMAETEKKLAQVMGSDGYARMMYEQNLIWQNVTSGQSLEEIMQRVNAMEDATETMKAELREGQERLKKLGESEAVRAMRSYVGKSQVDRLAAAIRKDYGSRMNKQDLMDGLTRIALKMAAGQDVQQDLEDLAGQVIDAVPGEGTGLLTLLKGTTIRLSEAQVKELYGSNSSLKEVRSRLAGTGVKVAQAKNGEAALDANWDELCDVIPSLDRDATDLDQVGQLLDAIDAEKRALKSGGDRYRDQMPNVMADLLAYASIVGQDIPTDAKSKAQIDRLMKYIQEMAGEVNAESDRIDNMIRTVDDLQARARSAGSRVGSLKFDIQSAINYMDETAKQAILREKEKKQSAIVEQLKSDKAQELMRVNQQWRDMMERDRNARKIAEDNAGMRNRVDKLATRVMKYLSRPDAQKFVPEHMQDMARVLLEMIVDNDLGGRHLTEWETKALVESKRVLDAWTARDGDADIYNSALAMDPNGDMGMVDLITDLYLQLGEGLEKYNAYKKNQTKLEGLKARNEALNQIQDAFTQLYNMISSEMNIALGDRKVAVMDAAMKIYAASQQSRFKGERKGFASRQREALHKFIISGNLTPEYFFKMLKNYGLDEIWEEYHRAENRNGLLMKSAKDRLAEIAEKHGYKSWDMDQKFTLQLEKGGTVQMTLGQMMSLMATWNREQKLGPEMSQHLEYGGFVLEDREKQTGKPRREKVSNKPRRVTGADMVRIGALLSDEQKEFVDEVVQYLSKDMSEIGNDASMRAFGIKKYKEKYYFPMKSWNGNLNQRSDQTGNVNNDSRLMHQGFTKQRLNRARNALLIGDFMDVAVNHIVGMVNYATMGVANENLQKVLNARMEENGGESGDYDYDNLVKRNIRAIIEEAYGKETADYLDELKKQMNGGIVKEDRDFWDKGLSLFRKNAVAGSLSVAAQQPLSYIRAAMMINPKYLMQALNPKYWKGSYAEMMEHSGVAVIKDMGRFDMNAGQTAKQFIKPDEKTGKARAAYEWIGDKATILPELMDRMTWTRMWTAVKLEQAEEHPGMNQDSAAFMDLCAERFNDVMRKTQVYDSTLVKSANMRSQSRFKRSVTSFMAEPTLTLNVLADAVQNARTPGGKARLAKAMAVFIVSAIAQAAIKAGFSSGRSPDDDKTWLENFLNRFGSNVLSEANPVSLIPGYSDLIAVLKTGELEDDALGAYGKIITAGKKIIDILNQKESKNGLYRDIEDSIGQLAQIFTNVPAKNIMRDGRAIYNWFSGDTYAKRPTSANILKYQALETLNNADNLWGVFNKWLGDAGYKTDNAAYYKRLYNAKKEGNAKEEQDLLDYLLNGKNVKQETIDSKVKSLAKDDSEATEAEKIDFMLEEEMDPTEYIRDQYKEGKMTRAEAEKGLKAANPDKSDDDIWWIMDRMDYQKETGESVSGNYYRLKDAIAANDSKSIQSAIKLMLAHGYTEKQIKEWLGSKTTGFKTAYLNAKGYDKVKIKDALIKAYKAIGINSAEAEMIINKWK